MLINSLINGQKENKHPGTGIYSRCRNCLIYENKGMPQAAKKSVDDVFCFLKGSLMKE